MIFARHIKRALRSTGFYRRRLARAPYRGVAVLTYHGIRDDRWPAGAMQFGELHVTAARLSAHLETLRELDCNCLGWQDWCDIADGRRALPPRAVMVSFDDGYRSVLTQALPILERYQVPAVVFVCTGPVERQVRFWFDAVASDGEAAVEQAKLKPYAEWQDLVARRETPVSADDPHAPLSTRDVQALAEHPLVAIGGHTVNHPILARADVATQRDEIRGSRRSLEEWVRRPVTAFAYPNGQPGIDFTSETSTETEALGFAHAFTTASGFADPSTARYQHPRFFMLDSVDGSELAHRLAVTWPTAYPQAAR